MRRNTLLYNSTPPYVVAKFATGSASATANINITGIPTNGTVNMIVISTAGDSIPSVIDSSLNTYSGTTAYANAGIYSKIYYIANPTVASSMTFTITGAYLSTAVLILTGNPSSPTPSLDKNTGNNGTGTSLATGNITPSSNGQFIIACAATGGPSTGTPSAVSGYTLINIPFSAGARQGLVTYYQTQTAATTTGVTFSATGTITYYSCTIASFIN